MFSIAMEARSTRASGSKRSSSEKPAVTMSRRSPGVPRSSTSNVPMVDIVNGGTIASACAFALNARSESHASKNR